MIDNDKYKEVLESGLILDHYYLLCNMKNNIKSVKTKRIEGFINLLTKKGYIENGSLTKKAHDLVGTCEPTKVVVPVKIQFSSWVEDLHKKCQDKIKFYTGEEQFRPTINKRSYPFLPNVIDLNKALQKVMVVYKLRDHKKIEETILRYIDKRAEENSWFPLLQYYIMKNGASQLVTDIESPQEDVTGESKSSQKFI